MKAFVVFLSQGIHAYQLLFALFGIGLLVWVIALIWWIISRFESIDAVTVMLLVVVYLQIITMAVPLFT